MTKEYDVAPNEPRQPAQAPRYGLRDAVIDSFREQTESAFAGADKWVEDFVKSKEAEEALGRPYTDLEAELLKVVAHITTHLLIRNSAECDTYLTVVALDKFLRDCESKYLPGF